jgi:hypothetical protein
MVHPLLDGTWETAPVDARVPDSLMGAFPGLAPPRQSSYGSN